MKRITVYVLEAIKESKGAGHSSRHKSMPSDSTTLFAKNIGALVIQGISHVLVIMILESFRVIGDFSERQIAKKLSKAILSKLRMEQKEQTCWQKGTSLQSTIPISPEIHSSESFISTKRDSGMLIIVVQRSAMAIFTIKLKATFLIRAVRRVIIIIKRFPIKDTAIITINAVILATLASFSSFPCEGQV